MDVDPPLMFVSFPSTKDPNWTQHPGRENKATMAIITLANWDWYKRWDGNTTLHKRGEEYMEIKKTIGQRMIDRCCDLVPKIKGLDHTRDRLGALNCALLRPQTDIPGLVLTGQ